MRSPPRTSREDTNVNGRINRKETSMERALRELRKRKKNQGGFTLIEMLVVISILGILAAVVTMSMVGVVNLARHRADQSEQQTVQVAMDTMLNENQVDTTANPCSVASPGITNMASFPASGPTTFTPPTHALEPLYPRYLRISTTQQAYWCDGDGTVHGTGP
jgi:prepilin-type N-terminal cleavage/methylation domain-containing protein